MFLLVMLHLIILVWLPSGNTIFKVIEISLWGRKRNKAKTTAIFFFAMLSYAVIILHWEVAGHLLACNVLWNTFLFSLGYQHSSILHPPIFEVTAFVLFILSWRASSRETNWSFGLFVTSLPFKLYSFANILHWKNMPGSQFCYHNNHTKGVDLSHTSWAV